MKKPPKFLNKVFGAGKVKAMTGKTAKPGLKGKAMGKSSTAPAKAYPKKKK